jgi:hypothetical protein
MFGRTELWPASQISRAAQFKSSERTHHYEHSCYPRDQRLERPIPWYSQYLCSIDLFRDFWPNHNVPPTIKIIPGEDGFPFIYSAQHKMISGEEPGVRSGTKSSGER